VTPVGDAIRLAVGTLTAWPVGPPGRVDRAVSGRAMLLAPLVGVGLAAVIVVARLGVLWAGLSTSVAAVLAVAALAVATRGLHLDGLADTCDGLAASYDRDRALAVMRTGDVGPAGATAVALVLLVDAAALADLLRTWAGTILAVVAVASGRHTLAWLCRPAMPAARLDGLGAAVAGSVPAWASGSAALLLAGVGALATAPSGLPWYAAPLTLASAVAAASVLGRRAHSRLGGVTGDVLGAGLEVGVAAALVVASVMVR
jgi:adenosylcobinamide-GDP ribazoletransferase